MLDLGRRISSARYEVTNPSFKTKKQATADFIKIVVVVLVWLLIGEEEQEQEVIVEDE